MTSLDSDKARCAELERVVIRQAAEITRLQEVRKFVYTDNGDEYHALRCDCAMCRFHIEKRKNLGVPLLGRCGEDSPPLAG